MTDGETSGLVGEVSLSASLQVAEGVASEEIESEEPEESGHSDEEEDEDEINHSALPKETVRSEKSFFHMEEGVKNSPSLIHVWWDAIL